MSKIKDTQPIEHQSELQKTIWNRHVEKVMDTYYSSAEDISLTARHMRMEREDVIKIVDKYKK